MRQPRLSKDVIWRKENGCLFILDPTSRSARFYGAAASALVDQGGTIRSGKRSKALVADLLALNVLEQCRPEDGEHAASSACTPPPAADARGPSFTAPLNVTIQVTNACNLRCGHCHNPNAGSTHMGFDDFAKIVTELRAMRVLNINLSGGEAMLNRRIYDMIALVTSLGMKVTMSTNCTFMDADKATALRAAGLRQAHVSLDSHDSASHDAMRGRVGAFAKMKTNLRFLSDTGIQYTLVTTLRGQSVEEYGATIDMAFSLGASAHKTNTVVPQGRGHSLAIPGSRLMQHYITEFRRKRSEYQGRMGLLAETMFALQMRPHGGENVPPALDVGCPAGILTCGINQRGDVIPCSFFTELIAGNAVRDGFREIWEHSPLFNELRQRDQDETCSRCHFSSTCGGCRARSYGMYGELHRTDPLCSVSSSHKETAPEQAVTR